MPCTRDNLDIAHDVLSKTDGAETASAYALVDIAESLRIIATEIVNRR